MQMTCGFFFFLYHWKAVSVSIYPMVMLTGSLVPQ